MWLAFIKGTQQDVRLPEARPYKAIRTTRKFTARMYGPYVRVVPTGHPYIRPVYTGRIYG